MKNYYEIMLKKSIADFCLFFDDSSGFSHSETAQFVGVASGKANILKLVSCLDFSECRIDVESFEVQSQQLNNNMIVVMTTGMFARNGHNLKQFAHTLILLQSAESNGKVWFSSIVRANNCCLTA